MTSEEFIRFFILELNAETFKNLKTATVGSYTSFPFIDTDQITKEMYAEKLFDYLEILSVKTGKSFDYFIEHYTDKLKSVIEERFSFSKHGKKEETKSRTERYYDKALAIIKKQKITCDKLVDYTRIMLCLYASVIKAEGTVPENFDFSASVIDYNKIIEEFKNEVNMVVPKFNKLVPEIKKKIFDPADPVSLDVCAFWFTVIISSYILDIYFEILGGNRDGQ